METLALRASVLCVFTFASPATEVYKALLDGDAVPERLAFHLEVNRADHADGPAEPHDLLGAQPEDSLVWKLCNEMCPHIARETCFCFPCLS